VFKPDTGYWDGNRYDDHRHRNDSGIPTNHGQRGPGNLSRLIPDLHTELEWSTATTKANSAPGGSASVW